MAVIAHWIERVVTRAVDGALSEKLVLRADLIGFLQVPGSHTGEHICTAFVHILDTLDITKKVRLVYISARIDKLICSSLDLSPWITLQIMTPSWPTWKVSCTAVV